MILVLVPMPSIFSMELTSLRASLDSFRQNALDVKTSVKEAWKEMETKLDTLVNEFEILEEEEKMRNERIESVERLIDEIQGNPEEHPQPEFNSSIDEYTCPEGKITKNCSLSTFSNVCLHFLTGFVVPRGLNAVCIPCLNPRCI